MEKTVYEFGVMSSRWTVEATSRFVARMAFVLYFARNIPIAQYRPEEGAFMPLDFLEDPDSERLGRINKEEIKEAIKTIVKTA